MACSAIENGFEDFECECKGKIKVGDTIYSCQKSKIHGKEKLKNALANSCNCYFVKLALALGSEKPVSYTHLDVYKRQRYRYVDC